MRRALLGFMLLTWMGGLVGCAPNPDVETIEAWPADERAEAQVKLGQSYLARNNLDVARESFKKAIDIYPASSKAFHGLGLVEAKALNLDRARTYLKRAVALDPKNIPAVSDYAILLCEKGASEQGVNLLEKNVLHPELIELPTQLAFGRCYQANGQTNKALQAYKAVINEDPNQAQALLSMAHLNFDMQNYLSASAFLQRYFYTNKISSDSLLLGARVEDALDNSLERDHYTAQLWSRYPRSEQAREARELFSQ